MTIVALLLALVPQVGRTPPSPALPTRDVANPMAKVATHYYYWYKWPEEHFKAGRPKAQGHFHHFKNPESVSYLSSEWHERQFADMVKCGIDFALPVYWGPYDRPGIDFSTAGLSPMVAALERIEKRNPGSMRLGMFFDTNVLRNDVRGVLPKGGMPDLRTAAGKRLFCRMIVGFFEKIPKRFWARMHGRALVVLYGFNRGSAWDESLGTAIRTAFATRFPEDGVFLVADRLWGQIGQDRQTSFSAVLDGPHLFPGVAELGPGFDDSKVPGRTTPSRPRENGDYYRWSWREAIAARPELVILETWNEVHEGSEICETKELGRAYIELTREWVGRLRSGDLGPPIELRHHEPILRPDLSWGVEAKGVEMAYIDYTKAEPERLGLREREQSADSQFVVRRRSLRPRMSPVGQAYLYFQVSDSFCFDTREHVQVTVIAEPFHGRELQLEYDARNSTGIHKGAFTVASSRRERGSGTARRVVFDLPNARFGNRQNGGADFRFKVRDVRTAIRRIEVRVVPR